MANKFAIGQSVHCFRKENKYLSGFDFIGEVLAFNLVDTDMWEYEVHNAPKTYATSLFPLLIWESEMVAAI